MKALIELTITMIVDVLDGKDEDDTTYYLEEHRCIDNLIEQLHDECESRPNMCNTCWRGEVKYLGEAAPEDVERYAGPFQGEAAPA